MADLTCARIAAVGAWPDFGRDPWPGSPGRRWENFGHATEELATAPGVGIAFEVAGSSSQAASCSAVPGLVNSPLAGRIVSTSLGDWPETAPAFPASRCDMRPRFPLGKVTVKEEAALALTLAGQDAAFFLEKHAAGDWGDAKPGAQRTGLAGRVDDPEQVPHAPGS